MLEYYIFILIVHLLFVKSMTILCLTMFCALAERQQKSLKFDFASYIFQTLSVGIIILIDTNATSIKQNVRNR